MDTYKTESGTWRIDYTQHGSAASFVPAKGEEKHLFHCRGLGSSTMGYSRNSEKASIIVAFFVTGEERQKTLKKKLKEVDPSLTNTLLAELIYLDTWPWRKVKK